MPLNILIRLLPLIPKLLLFLFGDIDPRQHSVEFTVLHNLYVGEFEAFGCLGLLLLFLIIRFWLLE